MTVVEQGGMILPIGAGIGATHPACAVMSFMRAAGMPQCMTLNEPMAMTPGPLGTQLGSMQIVDMLPTTAACSPSIITVGAHAMTIVSGSPG